MKKIIIAFAALAAALCLVSCNKEQIETPSTVLKLNISVAEMDGAATKAAKTSWTAGDKIMIWYKGPLVSGKPAPDLVIKYDGTTWAVDPTAEVSGKTPSASGDLCAAYMSVYPKRMDYWSGANFYKPELVYNYAPMPLAVRTPIYEYSEYSYADGCLTATLDKWEYVTALRFVVKDAPNDGKTRQLTMLSDKDTGHGKCASIIGGVTWNGARVDMSGESGRVSEIKESDGLAFYFESWSIENSDITFTMYEIAGQNDYVKKTYTVTNKTIVTSPSTLKTIVLNYSDFE